MFTWGVIKSVGYQLENIATRGHVPRRIYLFSLFQSQKRHQPTLICVLHSQLPPQGHTCGSILSRHGIRKIGIGLQFTERVVAEAFVYCNETRATHGNKEKNLGGFVHRLVILAYLSPYYYKSFLCQLFLLNWSPVSS